jgi:adenylate kinase
VNFQDTVIDLLAEAITNIGRRTPEGAKGFVIDGFPANLEQARLFEKLVGAPGKIILFDMGNELMRIRLEGRGNFDDNAAGIRKRIETFNEVTKPVLAEYAKSVTKVFSTLYFRNLIHVHR